MTLLKSDQINDDEFDIIIGFFVMVYIAIGSKMSQNYLKLG